MNKILIITEANAEVASGHLYESIELARILKEEGIASKLMVNSDVPMGLKDKLPRPYIEYAGNVENAFTQICSELACQEYGMIVTDLRKVENKWLVRLGEKTTVPILCIDEFGGRQLDADVIINPMIDPVFWNFGNSSARIYCGQEYLILPQKLRAYHMKKKDMRDNVERICISMGGVDLFGTTLKLMKWFPEKYPDIKFDTVLGAGFQYRKELNAIVDKCMNVSIYENIDYIYELFHNADIAFCAGGNTLHELACIGTPTVIIPTMEHEINNGRQFQIKGFGICLKRTAELEEREAANAIEKLQDSAVRKKMSDAGRRICKGDGGDRTVQIIKMFLRTTE